MAFKSHRDFKLSQSNCNFQIGNKMLFTFFYHNANTRGCFTSHMTENKKIHRNRQNTKTTTPQYNFT